TGDVNCDERVDGDDVSLIRLYDVGFREAHFAGQVAGLLKKQSSTLVAGGWDEGVADNVSNFTIIAIK
ncbi:MAG: hypothetical protein AAF438_03235, partial [Pseudomonadota bacterium]